MSAHKRIPAKSAPQPVLARFQCFEVKTADTTIPSTQVRDMTCAAMEIARGARTVFEIVAADMQALEMNPRNDADDCRLMLGTTEREELMRLAMAALELLGNQAEAFGNRHLEARAEA